jgi:hypothetical protein
MSTGCAPRPLERLMLVHESMRAFRLVAAVVTLTGGCSTATMGTHDGSSDVDGAGVDGAATDAPPGDAPGTDGPLDAAGTDASPDGGVDAAPCTISMGHTPGLDGVDDLADYQASQRLVPGATMSGTDEVAITWDPSNLYVTVTSDGFLDGAKPLHVYVETGASLGAAAPLAGKEYGGNVAQVPFSATHLIAVRRTNDFGTGGYDGVYSPAGAQPWMGVAYALEPGTRVFASSDMRTLSVSTPWSALGGCPLAMRVSAHVVNGAAGNEWKDLVPGSHTPWLTGGGGYYEASLAGDPAISGWTLR